MNGRFFAQPRQTIHTQDMRNLPLDWADLELAFRDATTESYLDRDSGEVLSVVDGFEDEADVRQKIARQPQRYVRIHAIDKQFAMAVIARFAATEQRPKLRAALLDTLHEVGGFSRALSLLREDKAAYAAFSRFEQNEVLSHIESFLQTHHIGATTAAPPLELFEGLSS
jgi:hypothetical protein